jgi:hypothetical protein
MTRLIKLIAAIAIGAAIAQSAIAEGSLSEHTFLQCAFGDSLRT